MDTTYRFTLTVHDTNTDNATAQCYSLGMIGCEEINKDKNIELFCYFDNKDQATEAAQLIEKQGYTTSEVSLVAHEDWNAKWRDSIEPVKIADSIWVSPEWLTPPKSDDDYWIKIEPRMAFGTGHHETTRLSSKLIMSSPTTATSLLDIGTGSGILTFVAEYAGYERITGVEIDSDCRINLEENLAANRKQAHIDFLIGTMNELEDELMFDTVVMNMIRTISEPQLDACAAHLNPGGQLIWSGILVEEKERVVTAARKKNWRLKEEITENEWWAGRFERIRTA